MTVWFVSRSDDTRAIAQHAALHKSVGNSIESVPENFTALKSWKPGENNHRSLLTRGIPANKIQLGECDSLR